MNRSSGRHRGREAPTGAVSCSVLIICAANTARSVMAEHLLRRELSRRGIDGLVTVRSAGIAPYARDGALISLDTRLVLREDGIEISAEAGSTDLKRHPELLEAADFVIAMTEQQVRELMAGFPAAAGCDVHTLSGFAGEAGDIEDPYEKGEEVFAECRDRIKRLVPRIAERLLCWPETE